MRALIVPILGVCVGCDGVFGLTTIATPDGPGAACSSASVFCDDFERDNVALGWDNMSVDPSGSLMISTARAVSATRSLHATIAAGATGSGNAWLIKSVGAAATGSVALSCDLYLETVGLTTTGHLVELTTTANDGSMIETQIVYDQSRTDMTYLNEGIYPPSGPPMFFQHKLTRSLRVGQWEHVVLKLTLAPGQTTAHLTFGGDTVLPSTVVHATPGDLELIAPINYVETPSQAWSVYLDNIDVELTP